MKRVLIDAYGWPDNFKGEKWKRDRKKITEEIHERQRRLDEEKTAIWKSELEESNVFSELMSELSRKVSA